MAATSSSPSAEPCAASVFCAFGAGQAMIERIAMKDGRSVTGLGRLERLVERVRVEVAVRLRRDALDVPAVRLVPLDRVLGDGRLGVALDRDVVVVPQQDQVAELLVAGQRGRLGGDALLEAAVTGDGVDRSGRTGRSPSAASGSNRPRS